MILIEFTKKFATKSKGDKMEIDPMQASYLIHKLKVAKKAKKE